MFILHWLWRQIFFFATLALGIWLLYTKPVLCDAILAWNARWIESLLISANVSGLATIGLVLPLKWLALGIEVLVLAWFVRVLLTVTVGSFTGWVDDSSITEMARALSILLSAGANIVMAFYAFSVLWGNVSLFGTEIFPAYNPVGTALRFADGITIGQYAAWYAVSQALPFFFRGTGNLWSTAMDFLLSVPSIVMILGTGLLYLIGAYNAGSVYRVGFLAVNSPIEILDIVNIVYSLRLIQRVVAVQEQNGAVAPHGGHHVPH